MELVALVSGFVALPMTAVTWESDFRSVIIEIGDTSPYKFVFVECYLRE